MTTLLRTEGLTVDYGGLRAVNGLTLSVEAGQLVGLIGPNGAGKTSAVDAITGFTRSSGSVRFMDEEIGSLPPAVRASRGLGRTWQSAEIFSDLTVADNLRVATETGRPGWGFLLDVVQPRRRRPGEEVDSILELLEITEIAHQRPSELSHGQTKLVGIGRALAGRPKVVLLDEPAAGLDTEESRLLGDRLRTLCEQGFGLLLIDHDIDLVAAICDYIYVVDFGAMIAEGTPRVVLRSQAVIDAYLGSHAVRADDGRPAAGQVP